MEFKKKVKPLFIFLFISISLISFAPSTEFGFDNPNLPKLVAPVVTVQNITNINITNITNINQFDQDLNTTDDVTFNSITIEVDVIPDVNNTGSVGLEQQRWNSGFFTNLNVTNIGGLSPVNFVSNVLGIGINITADNFFGNFNASFLQNPPWVLKSGDNMTGNLTIINANLTANNLVATEDIIVGGNVTFSNQGIIWENASCVFISSPSGISRLEVCD